MRIALFGATGAAGRLALDQALAAGHTVTAYVRDAGNLSSTTPQQTVIEGQLGDAAAIDRAIAGQDAVISLLGPKGSSEGLPVSKGTALIVAAMQRHGVKRLIATATPSARDPKDRFSLPFALAVMIRALQRGAYDDIVATAAVVRGSSLDWTLARLPMLADPRPGATVHAGYVGDGQLRLFSLSRNALADFLLAEATDPRWIGTAPALSDKR